MTTRIILIRHGVTNWNKEGRYCGHIDVSLSSEGKKQAIKLRSRLKSINFDKIYSSDKKRALQTARIIFKKTKITKIKGLREINFGVIEGLNHKEIMNKYPVVYKKWLKNPFKNRLPKAESMNNFRLRVNRAIKNIVHANPGKTIGVVCHGGVISIFISGILKEENFWRYIPKTASITIVEYKKDKPKIKLFNKQSI